MRNLWILFALILTTSAVAQPEALEGLKASAASNKAQLAKYSWQEEQTLSVGGELKRTTVSTVTLDVNGQPVKTKISEEDAPEKKVRGPLRKRIKERKVEDFKDSMQKLGQLLQSYAHPDPEKLEAVFKSGHMTVDTSGGPTQTRFTFKGYLKPDDILVLVFDASEKVLKSVQVNSYLDSPDEVVEIDATFDRLPDGTSHLSQSTVVEKKNEVTIVTKNSHYVKR